ncbi:GNAT family N-acetyltransferase [Candidatus Daviesbacteria bacterium]|nr:GNAT family N-acetyltransferase [Candidatus Daviesbacteria bacterium]
MDVFAKLSGELIGLLGTRETNPPDTLPTIKISGVYIASKARGRGIGKKLMLHLLKEVVRNPRWKKVKIKVFPTQEIAINLYKSLGFEVIEKVTEDFPSGIKRETFVMEKSLINP